MDKGQISHYELEKLWKRLDKLETQVYYLQKFKKEIEHKEYIREQEKKQKFLEKNQNKL